MTRARLAAIAIAIASLLALPGAAQAASPVKRHVAHGRVALAEARHMALTGHARGSRAAAAEAAHSARLAKRAARRLHSRSRRAKALEQVAGFDDESLGTYAAIIDRVPATLQDEVAQALGDAADARQQIVALLTQLLPGLPDDLSSQIADALSSLESDGDIEALLQALGSGELTDEVNGLVTQLVDQLSGDLNDLMDELSALASQLPPDQAAALEAAIADLQAALDGAGDTLDQLLGQILLGGGDLGSLCELLTELQVTLPIDLCSTG